MTKKEAIEVIKTTMPYMWKETKEAIQTLIPEFAESDDEKIRKEIIDFLIYGIWNTTTIDNVKQSKRCTEWIVYLEKLKEQPTNEEMLRTLRVEYEKGVADTIAKYEQKEQKPVELNDDTEVGLNCALQIVKHAKGNLCCYQSDDGIYECDHAIQTLENILKNGIEQKSAELPKSEDYGIDGLYAAVDILQKTLGEVDGYQTDDGILEHKCAISAVKELYKQQKEQKPAEWNEEDSRILYNVIAYVGYAAGQRGVRDDLFKEANDWLKFLLSQPKNELSEKYKEKFITDYLVSLGYPIDANGNIPNYNQTFEFCKSTLVYWLQQNLQKMLANKRIEPEGIQTETLLKDSYIQAYREGIEDSIRELSSQCENSSHQPYWKPSEEQMKALEEAMDRNDKIGYILRTLRDDIKNIK